MNEKKYLTYEEAMEHLGIKRSTLYLLITEMKITAHKFKGNRKHYLAFADVEQMKERRETLQEKPWEEAA